MANLQKQERSEETLIIEDDSLNFAQISQHMQAFTNQECLNSKLNESSLQDIYNLDREFSQLF